MSNFALKNEIFIIVVVNIMWYIFLINAIDCQIRFRMITFFSYLILNEIILHIQYKIILLLYRLKNVHNFLQWLLIFKAVE